MKKIYEGQTALRLSLKTGIAIEGHEALGIRFRKPDGVEGTFTAQLKSGVNGVIYHDFEHEDELDLPGWWRFWAWIRYTDGRTALGQGADVFVYREGD